MRSDGSTIYGRCEEPRTLIQLPLDLRTVDEYERRIRLAERKPTKKRVVEASVKQFFFSNNFLGEFLSIKKITGRRYIRRCFWPSEVHKLLEEMIDHTNLGIFHFHCISEIIFHKFSIILFAISHLWIWFNSEYCIYLYKIIFCY